MSWVDASCYFGSNTLLTSSQMQVLRNNWSAILVHDTDDPPMFQDAAIKNHCVFEWVTRVESTMIHQDSGWIIDVDPASYDQYKIVGFNMNTTSLCFQVSKDGGATFDTSNNYRNKYTNLSSLDDRFIVGSHNRYLEWGNHKNMGTFQLHIAANTVGQVADIDVSLTMPVTPTGVFPTSYWTMEYYDDSPMYFGVSSVFNSIRIYGIETHSFFTVEVPTFIVYGSRVGSGAVPL